MNFDLKIERSRTASLKWDHLATIFGAEDVLPMWVADMDFAAPPAVIQAMKERVEHGVFGYTLFTDNYRGAITDWMKNRHNWTIQPEWIQYCPGVVPAMSLLVEAFTEPGDEVIIQTPVYPPFYKVVTEHGRELIQNPLLLSENGDYSIDFADLEAKLASGRAKMLLLCSPHNPVGRVWTREELARVAELCQQYDVLVVSDEIHADLVFEGVVHTPFASLSEDAAERSFICTAPSKTFNIAGLNTANIIIPNDTLRRRFQKALDRYALGSITPIGAAAAEAAYRDGGEWLDALLDYVYGNMVYAKDFIDQHIPELRVTLPQATYLMWLDFRGLGMGQPELKDFLIKQARIGLNDGVTFGSEAEGFMRMNMACTRAVVEDAMNRLNQAAALWRNNR